MVAVQLNFEYRCIQACISGFVYTLGDFIAQTYEGEGGNLDVGRAGRSGTSSSILLYHSLS